MKKANQIRQHAAALGWQLHRKNGKHQIWESASGNRMPLPSSPGKGRALKNAIAQLKRLA